MKKKVFGEAMRINQLNSQAKLNAKQNIPALIMLIFAVISAICISSIVFGALALPPPPPAPGENPVIPEGGGGKRPIILNDTNHTDELYANQEIFPENPEDLLPSETPTVYTPSSPSSQQIQKLKTEVNSLKTTSKLLIAEADNSGNLTIYLLIGGNVVFFAIVAFLIIRVRKHKKMLALQAQTQKPDEPFGQQFAQTNLSSQFQQQSSQMINQNQPDSRIAMLKQYINSNRNVPEETLRQALLSKGWPEDIIEEAFR